MIVNGIDLSIITDEEILFFIRIRGKSSYFKNVYGEKFLSQFKSLNKFNTISEYKKDADIHINLKTINKSFFEEHDFNVLKQHISIGDIISRCRGLRSIPYTESLILICRAFYFFKNLYETTNTKYIVTGAIDNYVMHIMWITGLMYGVKFIPVTGSFLSPEYNLISIKGESNITYSSTENFDSDSFKNRILDKLSKFNYSYKPSIKFALYNYLSYKYRYITRYILKYKILGSLEYECRFAKFLHGCKSLKQFLVYFKLKRKIIGSKGTVNIYIPLHWYPEATTDYWIDDDFHKSYYQSLFSTIDRLKAYDVNIIIKEHPHFIFNREYWVINEIEKKGVTILSPKLSTKHVFDYVDAVIVWNGSSGIESICSGVPTYKLTNSYYGDNLVPDISTLFEDLEQRRVIINRNPDINEVIEKVRKTSFKTF